MSAARRFGRPAGGGLTAGRGGG